MAINLTVPLQIQNKSTSTWVNVYPSKMDVSLMDVQASDSGRDVTGLMHNNVVTKKWKIELEFSVPTPDTVSTLLNAVNSSTFQVRFYNPMTKAAEEHTFYVGDRSIPVYMWRPNNKFVYNSLSFNIIEV